MNLAEITTHDGDLSKAINLYQTAEKLAPDRGLIYIRLGQLTLENGGTIDDAKAIWQEGAQKTVDADAKSQLEKLLAQ
jgi:cytochrome c-type biogenesis protein CcmH/NrfG